MIQKSMLKCLFIIFFFTTINIFSQDYSGNYFIEKIYKVEENDYIFLISNKNIKAFIASDNPNLTINLQSVKIKLKHVYSFQLTLDTNYYRTREPNKGFGVLLKNGKLKTLWDVKKDGPLPLIFSSANSKGLYINEITIKKD